MAADPWIVTPTERQKHEEQFKSLGPVNGFITGEQAKGLFMQSRLPPQILGLIWMLSDMDGDGKMNVHEFSVACKLINLKIRGFNLPQALPPTLKQTACTTPGSGPTTPAPTVVPQPQAPIVAPAGMPPVMPVQPMAAMMPSQPVMPVQPMVAAQQIASVPPMHPAQPMVAPVQPMAVPVQPMASVQPLVAAANPPLAQPVVQPAAVPAGPTPPGSATGTPPLQKTPSLDGDWGVPVASKLKFTQFFNTIDRTKSGFISGVQARNILIQSQLPQQTLAQIWALSDVDNDGRLSSEEFVLALYLCEQAKLGVAVPPALPPELIPPTQRRQRTLSIQSTGSAGTPNSENAADFEDKRRENFEKGQAELERRRKALLDAQRRETEERMRRERDEESRKEKARLDAERKRQEELEKEMQRQQEVESQREADRKRQEEMKEQARKDAEKNRQQEWEKQRLQELMNVRQRQQENLLALKAKNQSLTIELNTKDDRVKEVTQKISETRLGVTEIKATIDNMRSTRDTHMTDMNQLKAQARDQNQRLIALNQEKARLKARSMAAGGAPGAENAAIDASIAAKQVSIKQLTEKLEEMDVELKTKEEDMNNNSVKLEDQKESLKLTAERCSELYNEFSDKRGKVLELREKLINPDAAWGDTASSGWAEEPVEETVAPVHAAEPTGALRYRALYEFEARNGDELSFIPGDIITVSSSEAGEPGWLAGEANGHTGWFPEAYCEPIMEDEMAEAVTDVQEATPGTEIGAIEEADASRTIGDAVATFAWTATQNNHLSFNKGERITVREQNEQWMFGELFGVAGWFPCTYVRMVSGPAAVSPPPAGTPSEVPEQPPMPECLIHDDISQYYLAVYPYASEEPGDLMFEASELILVVKKDGDWWHGIVGERSGIFPSNYVQLCDVQCITSVADRTSIQPVTEEVIEETKAAEPVQMAAEHTNNVSMDQVQQEEQVAETQPAREESVTTPDSSKPAQQDDEDNKEISEIMANSSSKRASIKRGKKAEIAMVIAPYEATAANQLNLKRNQLVMVRKKTSSGWWEGQLQAKGKKKQMGWFPASYVKILTGSNRSTPVSMEMTERLDDNEVVVPEANPAAIAAAVQELKDAVIKSENKASEADKVQALYPYTAMNDDELTFETGDIIEVLDKEDAAWWKGALRGMEGVFPSNYVEPVGAGTPDDSLCSATDYSGNHNDRLSATFQNDPAMEFKRQRAIYEMIETEKNYLKDLRICKEYFYEPMKSSSLVSEEELNLIFLNWDELILVSSGFNKAFKVRRENSGGSITMIADVFVQQVTQLTPYLRFCSLQLKGSALLGEKCEVGGAWRDLMKKCQENPSVQGHTLTSFLLKPMQRITKYPLLIKQYLQFTPEGHPDHHNAIEALSSADTLCAQVNEAVRERDNTDKLEWMQNHVVCEGLQERLLFNSLTNTLGPRKLLFTGVLHKTKSKKELVVFLMSDILLLTTPSKTVATCTSLASLERALNNVTCTMYRKPMFLCELKAEPERETDVGMLITYTGASDLHVSASSSIERNNWLKMVDLAQKHIKDTDRSILQRKQSIRGRPPKGYLRMQIHRANDLDLSSINSNPQSFCEVSLGSQAHRTNLASSNHPKWDSSMQFHIKSLAEDVLCFTVYEKGFFKPNEFLGRAEVRVHTIYESNNVPGPQLLRLKLQEAQKGEIILKLSIQLFNF